ncbi:hypothetical protein AJ80_07882 [Polytolypa hystricis UAMH7299]|uniref:Uncharacterized protein n=1 Tax=Polytolypa hystricis (strain UAMH7299) TaxID=1447883 RepID=A0A2B7XGM8_POLH7|nr:hypothetical protein AJ80_07882 [Polytolypa hystricis UAMH7299]
MGLAKSDQNGGVIVDEELLVDSSFTGRNSLVKFREDIARAFHLFPHLVHLDLVRQGQSNPYQGWGLTHRSVKTIFEQLRAPARSEEELDRPQLHRAEDWDGDEMVSSMEWYEQPRAEGFFEVSWRPLDLG